MNKLTVAATMILGLALTAVAADNAAALEQVLKQFGPPAVWVAKPAAAPTIDGKLDDECWKLAKPVELVFLNAQPMAPSQKTTACVLADDKAIYFAIKCYESQPDRMVSAGTKRDDGAIWNGDTVELFLDPGHKQARGKYAHLIVNPKGVLFDEKDGSKDWNCDAQVAAGTFEGGWAIELAVPIKDLCEGGVPKVWGVNINRSRPEIGEVSSVKGLQSHAVKVKDPAKYREGEDTAWAPTWCESSHIASCFGHALLEAGTVEVKPPDKLIEILFKSDFDDGKVGPIWNAESFDGDNFRGPGKCIRAKSGGEATMAYPQPLEDVDDATIILALKMPNNGRFYWYARDASSNQCDPDRHETFMTAEEAAARSFLALDDYDTHSSKMAWKTNGRLWSPPGPWKMMTGYFGESSIGSIISPGKDWTIARTRLGQLRDQRSQGMLPLGTKYKGFTLAGGKDTEIDEMVIFRGRDVEPPAAPTGVSAKKDGNQVALSWNRAVDNVFTSYYRVMAGKEMVGQTHQLSIKLPAEKVEGKDLSIVAVDMYENASAPSEAVKAK